MASEWSAKQFGRVVDQFRESCPSEAWDDVLIRYAVLKARGPLCGPHVAKKLTNGKGIWELLGHAGNCQPRLLFYFSATHARLIVFVHAFIKQRGNRDYPPAIKLALKRRGQIDRGEKAANVISSPSFSGVH